MLPHPKCCIKRTLPIEDHVVPEPEYELASEAFKSNFGAGVDDGAEVKPKPEGLI